MALEQYLLSKNSIILTFFLLVSLFDFVTTKSYSSGSRYSGSRSYSSYNYSYRSSSYYYYAPSYNYYTYYYTYYNYYYGNYSYSAGPSGGNWWIPIVVIVIFAFFLMLIFTIIMKRLRVKCQTACCILWCCKCKTYRDYDDELIRKMHAK